MVNSFEVVLVPTIIIILGMLLRRTGYLNKYDSKLLSKLVLNICLPALIFTNIATCNITVDLLYLPIVALIISIFGMLIAVTYSKLRGYSKKLLWTLVIAVSLMNTAFIGYPVVLGVFGNDGFIRAVFFDVTIGVMFVFYGMLLVSQFGGDKKSVIKSMLSFMPLWALIFGLIFNIFNIPLGYVLSNVLDYLSDATICLIMLSLGLTIDFRSVRGYFVDTSFVIIMRLVLIPLIVYMVLSHFMSGLTFNIAVMDSAMPVAMNSMILAINYDLDSDLLAIIIFISTILSLFTLPLVISLL